MYILGSGPGVMNVEICSFLLNLSTLAECHTAGSRKAAQSIAFYGNNENAEGLPLSGINVARCRTLAPTSGRNVECNTKQEVGSTCSRKRCEMVPEHL